MRATPVYQGRDWEEAEAHFKNRVMVDLDCLDEEFAQLPADIAYCGAVFADANRESVESYRDRKKTAGRLFNDLDFLSTVEGTLGKRPNKEQIEGAIQNHPDYCEALRREIEAEARKHLFRSYLDALQAKRDALISFGAGERIERQREAFIRDPD